jgi:hypothetical protein
MKFLIFIILSLFCVCILPAQTFQIKSIIPSDTGVEQSTLWETVTISNGTITVSAELGDYIEFKFLKITSKAFEEKNIIEVDYLGQHYHLYLFYDDFSSRYTHANLFNVEENIKQYPFIRLNFKK